MSADINLLHLMSSSREVYESYAKFINKDYILIGDTQTILDSFGAYYKLYDGDSKIDWGKFTTWFRVVHRPTWKLEKHKLFELVFKQLESLSGTVAPDSKILEHFVRLDYATRISEHCTRVAEGREVSEWTESIEREISAYKGKSATLFGSAAGGDTGLASFNIDELLENTIRGDGLEWRLEDLNVALGPLHRGDLVFVCARPEVGKTSFVVSELTHMGSSVAQHGSRVVLFNNEERGRLFLRCLSGATGRSLVEIARDSVDAGAEYDRIMGSRECIQIYEPAGGFTTTDVERVLKGGNYGLIAINVLDKVSLRIAGGSELSDVERLRQLGVWARRIANQYAPVLVVLQADGSAEGQKYLNQSQIYGSKTGLQGEADAIIMIGVDPDVPDRRFLNIVKNKLPGGARSNPALRHGQFEVAFDETTGRYSSLRFK